MPSARLRSTDPGGTPHAGHFPDAERQRAAVVLGMWFFLATEALLFGGLFFSYTVYRVTWPEAFAEAGRHVQLAAGAANTAVLLTSSLFMTLAVSAAEAGSKRLMRASLVLTIALGALFLAIKGYEYRREYAEGLLPLHGLPFSYDGAQPRVARLFFGQYLLMTGLHAVHLLAGIALVGVMAARAWRLGSPGRDVRRLRVTGLYWHLVDVVWLFIFPLLYLA